jgi:hypothetical protein
MSIRPPIHGLDSEYMRAVSCAVLSGYQGTKLILPPILFFPGRMKQVNHIFLYYHIYDASKFAACCMNQAFILNPHASPFFNFADL